jgi:hypothetical protein
MINVKPSARPSIYKVLETMIRIDKEPPHDELYSKAIDMLKDVKYRSKDAQSAVAQLKKSIENAE